MEDKRLDKHHSKPNDLTTPTGEIADEVTSASPNREISPKREDSPKRESSGQTAASGHVQEIPLPNPTSRATFEQSRAQDTVADEVELPAGQQKEFPKRRQLEPTRYGDWEKKGRCIDF